MTIGGMLAIMTEVAQNSEAEAKDTEQGQTRTRKSTAAKLPAEGFLSRTLLLQLSLTNSQQLMIPQSRPSQHAERTAWAATAAWCEASSAPPLAPIGSGEIPIIDASQSHLSCCSLARFSRLSLTDCPAHCCFFGSGLLQLCEVQTWRQTANRFSSVIRGEHSLSVSNASPGASRLHASPVGHAMFPPNKQIPQNLGPRGSPHDAPGDKLPQVWDMGYSDNHTLKPPRQPGHHARD
ncbi:hypothetical protein BDP55DRAFT_625248 [Colletotrichum godetiae]|uniref:Uncharacterized protein n=1 Tax=Colletotrichum godetiae TaxID=1209918 RepID=A0AAJ0B1N6_9PEZI|nr:uncharacterized protein BDP55DRAFT_625248 [Colletotrichum godetiae]KAK1700986.1 hypothetical protein BDP55DRAFT_625248 [Colletotrichum godetiae]